MADTFLIGDTHFGHKKMADLRGFASVEDHDEALVERWNAAVRKRDTVWHLGDVLFGSHSFVHLSRLNGTKKLVSGNHDQYPTARYLEHFNRVVGAAEVAGCVLTHIPVHESQFHRYRFNIHGHLHQHKLPDPRYICVSAEHYTLTPVSLDAIIPRRMTTKEPGG